MRQSSLLCRDFVVDITLEQDHDAFTGVLDGLPKELRPVSMYYGHDDDAGDEQVHRHRSIITGPCVELLISCMNGMDASRNARSMSEATTMGSRNFVCKITEETNISAKPEKRSCGFSDGLGEGREEECEILLAGTYSDHFFIRHKQHLPWPLAVASRSPRRRSTLSPSPMSDRASFAQPSERFAR